MRHIYHADGCHYEAVAQWNLEAMKPPWCYRILTPALARLIDITGIFPDHFQALTYPVTLATVFALWFLVVGMGYSPHVATSLAVMYAFAYPTRKLLIQISTADPLTMLFMFAGIAAILFKKPVWFGIVTLLGTANREIALLLIPVAYIAWADRPWDRTAARKLLWIIPALILFAALRLGIPVNGEGFTGFYSNLSYLKICYLHQGGITGMLVISYSTFGILWLIALLESLKHPDKLVLLTIVLFLLCFGSLFFAHNTSRTIMIVAPLLFILNARYYTRHQNILFAVVPVVVLSSLVKFVAMSSWQPNWLMHFPLPLLRLIELSVFLGIVLATRTKTSEHTD